MLIHESRVFEMRSEMILAVFFCFVLITIPYYRFALDTYYNQTNQEIQIKTRGSLKKS